jgi:hypothetical protein
VQVTEQHILLHGQAADEPLEPLTGRLNLVADAPAEADSLDAEIERWPGWVSIALVSVLSATLWGLILAALRSLAL